MIKIWETQKIKKSHLLSDFKKKERFPYLIKKLILLHTTACKLSGCTLRARVGSSTSGSTLPWLITCRAFVLCRTRNWAARMSKSWCWFWARRSNTNDSCGRRLRRPSLQPGSDHHLGNPTRPVRLSRTADWARPVPEIWAQVVGYEQTECIDEQTFDFQSVGRESIPSAWVVPWWPVPPTMWLCQWLCTHRTLTTSWVLAQMPRCL